jgi:hypothetical protein
VCVCVCIRGGERVQANARGVLLSQSCRLLRRRTRACLGEDVKACGEPLTLETLTTSFLRVAWQL